MWSSAMTGFKTIRQPERQSFPQPQRRNPKTYGIAENNKAGVETSTMLERVSGLPSATAEEEVIKDLMQKTNKQPIKTNVSE